MALSEKHRSSIYLTLAPMLGEEEAEALLSQFPARELDQPVTKEFVRAEISGVRVEMADSKAELRGDISELRAEVADMRAELGAEMTDMKAELRTEMTDMKAELRTEMTDIEAGLRGDISELRAELYDRLRQQTMWMAGAVIAGMGVASGIASVIS